LNLSIEHAWKAVPCPLVKLVSASHKQNSWNAKKIYQHCEQTAGTAKWTAGTFKKTAGTVKPTVGTVKNTSVTVTDQIDQTAQCLSFD
jgi:hypothetical protein